MILAWSGFINWAIYPFLRPYYSSIWSFYYSLIILSKSSLFSSSETCEELDLSDKLLLSYSMLLSSSLSWFWPIFIDLSLLRAYYFSIYYSRSLSDSVVYTLFLFYLCLETRVPYLLNSGKACEASSYDTGVKSPCVSTPWGKSYDFLRKSFKVEWTVSRRVLYSLSLPFLTSLRKVSSPLKMFSIFVSCFWSRAEVSSLRKVPRDESF